MPSCNDKQSNTGTIYERCVWNLWSWWKWSCFSMFQCCWTIKLLHVRPYAPYAMAHSLWVIWKHSRFKTHLKHRSWRQGLRCHRFQVGWCRCQRLMQVLKTFSRLPKLYFCSTLNLFRCPKNGSRLTFVGWWNSFELVVINVNLKVFIGFGPDMEPSF